MTAHVAHPIPAVHVAIVAELAARGLRLSLAYDARCVLQARAAATSVRTLAPTCAVCCCAVGTL